MPADIIKDVEIKGIISRKLTQTTCQHFGYGVAEYNGHTVQVAPYYDAENNLVAQKIRGVTTDDDGNKTKSFKVLGSLKTALPFGAHCFPKTGRKIVVTEGEIDALSMSQAQNNKWPVVSISCGADNSESGNKIKKYIAEHKEYFSGFEEVILMFDNDAVGRKSAIAAAEVLGRKAKIADLPLKDAGEMLVAGRTEEMIAAMWRAKPYRPEGIVDLASLHDEIKQRPQWGLSWCFDTLNHLTYGKRLGELVAVGAGTGVGKTDFITQDMMHMISVHKEKIGIFALEQTVAETGIRLIGKAAQRPLHIPESWDDDLFEETWKRVNEEGRVFLYNSFGVNEWDTIKDKIEFMYHSEGVQYFYLDHLTALAAAEENEREGLEQIMASMGGLVKQIPIHITFVSHLATPDGKSHEEGGRVTIRHFKGSRSIGFWCAFMFGMERDQQHEDELVRQQTTFRVLKDRYTGRATGATFTLDYDKEKGMLKEASKQAGSYGFGDETTAKDQPQKEQADF